MKINLRQPKIIAGLTQKEFQNSIPQQRVCEFKYNAKIIFPRQSPIDNVAL